jgi:PPOX class probable F420-dependent enzyme
MASGLSDSVKAFLEKPNVAVLATQSRSGRVQATPVWFMRRGGEILINTSAGRTKLRNMEDNPRVALAIVDRENPYRYVQIQGTVVEFDRENAPKDIDRLSQRYLGEPHVYSANDAPRKRVSIHITPQRIHTSGL